MSTQRWIHLLIALLLVFGQQNTIWAAVPGNVKTAMQQCRQGQYDKAGKVIVPYADKHPRSKTANYYAGICKMGEKDLVGAKKYMSRILVCSQPGTKFHSLALTFFNRNANALNRIAPYSCLARGKLVRWKRSKKPLKVFISNGWMLPDIYGKGKLRGDKLASLERHLRSNNYRRGMRACPGFIPEMRNYAIWGLAQWDWAKKEGVLNYKLVNDPRIADIYLFWSPTLPGKAGFTSYRYPGTAAIIEIQTKISKSFQKPAARQIFMHVIAHEFGHSFGLQHSHNPADLMAPSTEKIMIYTGRGIGKLPKGITENDREALRVLYSIPVDAYLVAR